jgi:hypothetical protein
LTIEQTIGLAVSTLLEVVILSGLVARGRLGRCLAFTCYLVSILVTTVLTLAQPDVYAQRVPWQRIQVVYASLRHLMALELAFHTFKAFPAARRTARSFLWAMTILALAAPFMFGSDLTNHDVVSLQVVPRMSLAAMGLFAGLGALILWFRLPIDPMHKAIIMGIVPYLLLYSALLTFTRDVGKDVLDWINLVNTLAWIALMSFWAWVAWRPRRKDEGGSSLGLPGERLS